jgi:hypothetical protein
MYEKEPVNMKKATSQYYRESKCFSKSPKPIETTSRKQNRSYNENESHNQSQVEETVRRTPVK